MDAGILYIAIGFALGGILKGATGAGAPIIAIPLMAIFYNVPFAVAIFVVPNIVSNVWQVWTYRAHHLPPAFSLRFSGVGAIGAAIGTMMLVSFPSDTLKLIVAVAVFFYIMFRLLKPDWKLAYEKALLLSAPVGGFAGILQGASGVSAPISITFLNAMRLDRENFMPTISAFFLATGLVQIPMLYNYGFLSWERFWLSCAAMMLMLAFMPVGAFLAKRLSRKIFDRTIMVVLALLGLRLAFEALW